MEKSPVQIKTKYNSKKKSNFHPIRVHKGTDKVERYSSTLSLTTEQNGGAWLRPGPAALPPGMNRYVQYTRLGVPQGRPGWVRKISPTLGFDLRIV